MTDTPPAPETPAWMARIDIRDLGTLTGTVTRVQAVVGDERSSLADLSRVLQNDPTLVSKVLRIANSPSYMVTPEPVTTISRASNLIGFDAIRNICITHRLLDTLLDERNLGDSVKERLLRRVASSLHAAAQARMLLQGAGSREREEAFLAALLDRIGESAFWSAGGPEVEALDAALAEPGIDAETVVRKNLGGSFADMSRTLIQNWGLDPAVTPLETGYLQRDALPTQAQAVAIANELADVAAEDGWQSPRMKELFAKVARLLGIDVDEAAIRVRACGKQAEDLAACYGASELARRMAHRPPPEAARRKPAAEPERATGNDASLGGDSAVQLRVLRQMASMSSGGNTDINSVIRTAMEGVQQGIGMERTLTALLTTDRKELQLRLWLGDGGEEWSKAFRFPIARERDVLGDCIADLSSVRYDARNPGALARRIPATLMRFCQGQDFVLAPVAVGARSIGVLYADRAPGGGSITEQEFAAFVHFSQQLGSCLAQLTRRRS